MTAALQRLNWENVMTRFTGFTICGSLAILMLSCASTPKQPDSIAEARAAIAEVERMPMAGEVAAKEIEEAHTALREAERRAEKRKSANDISTAAYLAKRHADIAAEQISIAQSKKQVADAERERQRVLAAARAEEAERNARAAESANRVADAATRDAEAANREAEEAKRRIDLLQQELADLNAKKTDRGLVLTLGDVLFDTGLASLKPGALPAIDRLAKFMKESPDHKVMIEGHTDSVGTDEYNQDLSQRRADAVRAALTSRGVDGTRVSAVGKGEGYPIAGNNSAGGRQQNRRVEIVIES